VKHPRDLGGALAVPASVVAFVGLGVMLVTRYQSCVDARSRRCDANTQGHYGDPVRGALAVVCFATINSSILDGGSFSKDHQFNTTVAPSSSIIPIRIGTAKPRVYSACSFALGRAFCCGCAVRLVRRCSTILYIRGLSCS
jgi:hypothetical protein